MISACINPRFRCTMHRGSGYNEPDIANEANRTYNKKILIQRESDELCEKSEFDDEMNGKSMKDA